MSELKVYHCNEWHNEYTEFYLKHEADAVITELEADNKRIKLSAEKVLRDLLDCGLIKEWYFNGKFNAVLKADDPHLQIAELKAENKLLKEHIANGDVSRITWIDEVIELKEAQRWRKFSEEKPEHDAWCLVFHEGEIDADHYTDDCNSHDRFVMYGHYVTHWMPLPKAPEEYK